MGLSLILQVPQMHIMPMKRNVLNCCHVFVLSLKDAEPRDSVTAGQLLVL